MPLELWSLCIKVRCLTADYGSPSRLRSCAILQFFFQNAFFSKKKNAF